MTDDGLVYIASGDSIWSMSAFLREHEFVSDPALPAAPSAQPEKEQQ